MKHQFTKTHKHNFEMHNLALSSQSISLTTHNVERSGGTREGGGETTTGSYYTSCMVTVVTILAAWLPCPKGPSQKYLEANEVKYFSLGGRG